MDIWWSHLDVPTRFLVKDYRQEFKYTCANSVYTLNVITSVQLAYRRMPMKCPRDFTPRPAFLIHCLAPSPPQSLHPPVEMYAVYESFYTVPVLSGASHQWEAWRKQPNRTLENQMKWCMKHRQKLMYNFLHMRALGKCMQSLNKLAQLQISITAIPVLSA